MVDALAHNFKISHHLLINVFDSIQDFTKDAAHLLLAVNVAARVKPASGLLWPLGESMLPVLRGLECTAGALGWSSWKMGQI